jgi:hypothetical protein
LYDAKELEAVGIIHDRELLAEAVSSLDAAMRSNVTVRSLHSHRRGSLWPT